MNDKFHKQWYWQFNHETYQEATNMADKNKVVKKLVEESDSEKKAHIPVLYI